MADVAVSLEIIMHCMGVHCRRKISAGNRIFTF